MSEAASSPDEDEAATPGEAPRPHMNEPEQRPAASDRKGERNVLSKQPPSRSVLDGAVHARVLCALLCASFALWVGYAWQGYGSRHAQLGDDWHVGGVHLIELTLVKEDAKNLACASNVDVSGLHCEFRGDQETRANDQNDAHVLKPYNTTKNELLFGAGLWSSPALSKELPHTRFSVTCNYHVVGVVKSAATRWSKTGKFDPLKQSATFGYLTDCALPL